MLSGLNDSQKVILSKQYFSRLSWYVEFILRLELDFMFMTIQAPLNVTKKSLRSEIRSVYKLVALQCKSVFKILAQGLVYFLSESWLNYLVQQQSTIDNLIQTVIFINEIINITDLQLLPSIAEDELEFNTSWSCERWQVE